MMDSSFWVQGVGFLGTALYFVSFQCKKTRSLFLVQLAAYLFYTLHMLLLGAITGGCSYILNMVRSFCLGSCNDFLRGKGMCAILCALQLAVLGLTWCGWLSLLPVAANIVTTVADYTRKGRLIRLAALLVNSPMWILYDALVGSQAGIVDEGLTMLSAAISLVRFRKEPPPGEEGE